VSVSVELGELDAHIARFGPRALLVTTAREGPPRVTSVVVTFDAPHLAMRVGKRARANAYEHPDVALVWPVTDGRHCLIVDGTAHVGEGTVGEETVGEETVGAEETLFVLPVSAVLHRLAAVD
jgi:hypothetical protein